ncbi:MAG: hypothetical protein WCE94_09215 [Candidatus Methanoperedens sp.]
MTKMLFTVDYTSLADIGTGTDLMIDNTQYQLTPEYDLKFTAIPGYSGGVPARQQVSSKKMSLGVYFIESDAADVRAVVDQWNALIGPHTGLHKLYLHEWPDRYYKGIFLAITNPQQQDLGKWQVTLEFLAITTSYGIAPIGYPGAPPATVTLTSSPQTFTIMNAGSDFAYPEWIYTTVGTEGFSVNNTTIGEYCIYNKVSTAGKQIRLIFEPYLDDESEPYVSKYDSVIANSYMSGPIPRLAPGGNTVIVNGAAGGSFRAYWRKRDY